MRHRSRKHLWIDSVAGRSAGVTLVELIMVIVISGIVATMLTAFIIRPIEGYEAQVRRAELVDAAEMALRRIARDIRAALPNSVRILDSAGNPNSVTCPGPAARCAIEVLNTLDGARYREGPGNIGHNHGPPQFRLRFTGADTDGFNIVGQFENFQPALPFTSTTERLAVYNQGIVPAVLCDGTGADAYSDAGCPVNSRVVITNKDVVTFTIDDDGGGDELQIVPTPGGDFNFRWASPNQRVFIVDTPVTYICDPGTSGTITRFWNYDIDVAQPTTPADPELAAGSSALLSTPVTACTFTYVPGTPQRAGLVTLDITVGDTASGERVRLLHQVHVDNVP